MEALLEADPNGFWFRTFSFFLLVFFSLCNLPWGKVSPHKHKKRFILVFLLSLEALLEADPKEFSFGTFYLFFSLSLFSLCGSTSRDSSNEFDFVNFPYYSYFSSLCVKYPQEKFRPHKNTKQIFLSLSSLCGFSPWGRSYWLLIWDILCFFSLSLFSLCVRFLAIFVDVWSSWSEEHICWYNALYINQFSLIYRAVDL